MTWKRILGWIGLCILALIVIVAVGGYFTLRSNWFDRVLISKIEQQASARTGAQVRIQNLVLRLSSLSADVYGITVRGKEPESAPPLAEADEFTIRLKIVSLFDKKIDLSEIILHHPRVHLLVRKDSTTNLPTPPQSNSSSTNPFDLGIQHVLVTNGEIYYNDLKTPIDAELDDLRLEVRSRLLGKIYDGTLSYRDGRLQYGGSTPLPHDLNASFTATPAEFQLKPLVLTVARSRIELQGRVQDYSHPDVNGHYRFTIHPEDFRAALKNRSLPSGEISLEGSLHYHYQANAPLIRSVSIDGQLHSRELLVDAPQLHSTIRNVEGQFQLANGTLGAHGIAADLLGGHLTAVATMRDLERNPVSHIRATLESISLGGTENALHTANLRQIPIAGNLSGEVEASWAGTIQNLKARSDVTLKGAIAHANESSKVPLNAAFHVTYDGRHKLATLTNTFAHTPETSVKINGTAGERLNVTLEAHARDLRELDSLVAALETGGNNGMKSMNLAGSADATITVLGALNDPHIDGRLSGTGLEVENTAWKSFGMNFQASKSGVSITTGSLVHAQRGYLNFAGGAGLSNWHYTESEPIHANITCREIAIQELMRLANQNYPVSGNLSMDVSVHGSQLNPAGNGSIRVFQAKIYGQHLRHLSVQFNGDGNAINTSLEVATLAGTATADLTFNPKSKAYEVRINAPDIQLAKLQPIEDRNAGITGAVTITANGRGTLSNPQLTASIEIPQLQVRQKDISGIKAELTVANHKAQLALDSEVAQTNVKARADVNLNDDYYARATFDTKQVPIEALLAMFGPGRMNGPTGFLEVHGSAEGPLNDTSRMQAQLLIPTLKAEYQGMQIGNTKPVRLRYVNSTVTLDPTEIVGTDSSIKLQGNLPLRGHAPVTLAANGSLDMQLLRFFDSDIQSSGKLLLDARATGAAAHPQIAGQVHLQNVALAYPDAPVGLRNLNGVLDIDQDKITITQLSGESGGGQISASGRIAYRPQLEMNVALNASHVRILYQDQIRVLLDSNLNLEGNTQASNLTGRVLVNSLSFTPNFDLTSIAGQMESAPESMPSPGFTQNLKLHITVQTSKQLDVMSNQVSLQGNANLQVIGTAQNPVIIGRTDFTGGDIFLMNQRYQIQRGVIQFSNPNRTEPVLNVALTTTIDQYNLTLTFTGPLDKMQTSYISNPPLATADIVNLIARGQTPQQAANSTSNFSATSLLAQGAASEVSGGIQKLAGLSSFSIDPTLGGNDTNPGARIAMQKRVTGNLLMTFAFDVTDTQNEIIQGEYQFSKRWSASVTRNENGSIAVDGKFHTRF
jgi:translocation and assembly module TamB